MRHSPHMVYAYVSRWVLEQLGLPSPAFERYEAARGLLGHIVHFDSNRGGRVTRIGDADDRVPVAFALMYLIEHTANGDPSLVFHYDLADCQIYVKPSVLELTRSRRP